MKLFEILFAIVFLSFIVCGLFLISFLIVEFLLTPLIRLNPKWANFGELDRPEDKIQRDNASEKKLLAIDFVMRERIRRRQEEVRRLHEIQFGVAPAPAWTPQTIGIRQAAARRLDAFYMIHEAGTGKFFHSIRQGHWGTNEPEIFFTPLRSCAVRMQHNEAQEALKLLAGNDRVLSIVPEDMSGEMDLMAGALNFEEATS